MPIAPRRGADGVGAGAASPPTTEQVTQALAGVNDPEIHRPITELGMVKNVEVAPDGAVRVDVWLTVSGCPLRDTITREVTAAVGRLPGVTAVRVELDVMSDEQRRELQGRLRGGKPEREIPFASPASLTKVYAVASGKGGVGKSSVTVNIAVALAAMGQKVGLLDADIYGHSVPRMLGITTRPTQVEQMIMPPSAHGVQAISSGMLKKGNEPLPMRGPILHRLLQQFLADVFWGDLDVLLLDLPPGTGDIAISAAHLIPGSELIIVTTPQLAAAEVAERAGSLGAQLHQRIVGVIENMSYLPCPHCGERVDVFGSGGGQAVGERSPACSGRPCPYSARYPLTCACARPGTPACRWCCPIPTPRRRCSSGRSPRASPLARAAWPAGRSGLPPSSSRAAERGPGQEAGAGRAGRAGHCRRQGSGGLGVVGRALARSQPELCLLQSDAVPAQAVASGIAGAAGALATVGRAAAVVAVQIVHQVLTDEMTRIQVVDVEVAELRAEVILQFHLGAIGHPPQLTQRPAGLRGVLRQLIRSEDDQRDDPEHQELQEGKIHS